MISSLLEKSHVKNYLIFILQTIYFKNTYIYNTYIFIIYFIIKYLNWKKTFPPKFIIIKNYSMPIKLIMSLVGWMDLRSLEVHSMSYNCLSKHKIAKCEQEILVHKYLVIVVYCYHKPIHL